MGRSVMQRLVAGPAIALAACALAAPVSCVLPEYEAASENGDSSGVGGSDVGGATSTGAGAVGGSGAMGGGSTANGGGPGSVLGSSCETHGDCDSGLCVDDLCCNEPFTALCYTCSAAKGSTTNGQCEPVPDGGDPDADCPDQCLNDESLVVRACVDAMCEVMFTTPASEKCVGKGQ